MKRLAVPFALAATLLAQEAARPPEKVVHEVRLQGGTVLVGDVEPLELKVLTTFGELTVPMQDVRQVRFGRKADPERYQRSQEAIAGLAASNPDRRTHARAELVELGAYAAPDLAAAAASHADPEVRRVCQEVLAEMDVREDEYQPDDDVIETRSFSMKGQVVQKAFKVAVPELGSIDVKRRDAVQIRVKRPRRTTKLALTGENTLGQGWLDTKVALEKDERLRILADGTIQFPNWGGQMFTPDGNVAMGNVNGIVTGTLVGRMGDSGTMFAVGRSYLGAPVGDGTLQLCIMVNAGRQPSTGQFNVIIEIE
jgi:hypothetical protein